MKPNDETNNANEHNMVKNSNWQEADLLTIYKHDQETTSVLLVRERLEPATLTTRSRCLAYITILYCQYI